jgi:TolA-binding protein
MPVEQSDTVLFAVSAAFGATATAFGRMVTRNRQTDKVDAVKAVAAAFDKVAERTNRHVDDLSAQCHRLQDRVDYLERELRKRDEMILLHVGTAVQAVADSVSTKQTGEVVDRGKDKGTPEG